MFVTDEKYGRRHREERTGIDPEHCAGLRGRGFASSWLCLSLLERR